MAVNVLRMRSHFFTFEDGIFYKIKCNVFWDLMLVVWWKGTSVLVELFTSSYSEDKVLQGRR